MISKYSLYIIVLFILSALFLGPRFFYMLTYERTIGRKAGYYYEKISTKTGGYTKLYPKIRFYTDEYEVIFLAPSYMKEPYEGIEEVAVIYDKKNPENAYAYNFYGFWGPVLVYYLPIFLVWTILVFSINFMPKRVNFKAFLKKYLGY
jgi:hypothetical protein